MAIGKNTKQINLYLNRKQFNLLRELMMETGYTASQLVKKIIRIHYNRRAEQKTDIEAYLRSKYAK